MSALSVENVSVTYGSNEVLRGVDLQVEAGELVALLGPNGAGKTTLIEQLIGTVTPTAGTVTVLGSDPHRADEAWRARIGFVAQHSGDRPRWRLRDLLAWVRAHYEAVGVSTRTVTETAGLVGLEECLTQLLGNLSGGQRRRADIAAAIIGRPEVLILDEPTSGLDPTSRAQVHDLLADEIDRGCGVLVSTHDLAEAQKIADRIVILAHGQVRYVGTPRSLRDRIAGHAEVSWISDGVRHVHATDDAEAFVATLDLNDVSNLEIDRPDLEAAYIALLDEKGDGHE